MVRVKIYRSPYSKRLATFYVDRMDSFYITREMFNDWDARRVAIQVEELPDLEVRETHVS